MADQKISQLTAATTPLAGTEVLPIVQSGSTKKVSIADVTAGREIAAKSVTVSGNSAYGQGKIFATTGEGLLLQSLTGSFFDAGLLNAAGNAYAWTVAAGTNDFKMWNNVTIGNGSVNTHVLNGNVTVNSAAKGVDFSANTGATGKTSTLLNWYEEGTWTPDLTTAGGNFSSLTFGDASGTYTRVGRQVTVRGSFYTTGTVSGGSGQVYITGLPFSAASQAIGNVWVNPDTVNYNSPSALPTGVFSSGTQLRLFKNGSVNNTAFNANELAASGFANSIAFTCTYFV